MISTNDLKDLSRRLSSEESSILIKMSKAGNGRAKLVENDHIQIGGNLLPPDKYAPHIQVRQYKEALYSLVTYNLIEVELDDSYEITIKGYNVVKHLNKEN